MSGVLYIVTYCSNMFDLCLLHANSTLHHCDNQKCLQILPNILWGQKTPDEYYHFRLKHWLMPHSLKYAIPASKNEQPPTWPLWDVMGSHHFLWNMETQLTCRLFHWYLLPRRMSSARIFSMLVLSLLLYFLITWWREFTLTISYGREQIG